MKTLAVTSLFAAILLTGCGTTRNVATTSYHVTRDVAVGSYRVATAPVHYALRQVRGEASTRDTVSTETVASDVTQPGYTVVEPEAPSARQQQQRIESNRRSNAPSTDAPRVTRKRTTEGTQSTQAKTKPPASSQAPSGEPEFPTAKLVPGKPGYVVSPFDSSQRYVDVSGYTSGSKVKDPWTNKIFIVP